MSLSVSRWRQSPESPHLPAITTEIDLYDPDHAEVLLFEDGIQVKEQKPTRDHQPKESRTRINTDVVLLEMPDTTYHYPGGWN